jgi:hypothetical protein
MQLIHDAEELGEECGVGFAHVVTICKTTERHNGLVTERITTFLLCAICRHVIGSEKDGNCRCPASCHV